jgi:predicted HAD superfamily Cof-like phosphohydrolase
MNLIAEEYKELSLAWVDQDLVEIADACADLIWVIQGLNHTLGIPQQKVWDEVARSNMSKISENGKVLKRADGKVQKPESYSPPNIQSIINN